MKTTPLLFQPDMVNALLDGRKTQTRRIVDWKRLHKQAGLPFPTRCKLAWFKILSGWGIDAGDGVMRAVSCPYGDRGDLIWVREAFLCGYEFDENDVPTDKERVWYRASNPDLRWFDGESDWPRENAPWKPSIHMPRWASRLTLRITDIRVERMQDISREDAIAEGIERCEWMYACDPWKNYIPKQSPCRGFSYPPRSYQSLWESINGRESWEENPWVWVIEFEVIQANVDSVLAEAA